MTPRLPIAELFPATLKGAQQVALTTLGPALGFVVAVALLFWGAEALPETMTGSVGFLTLLAMAVGAHNLFSASMYRQLLPFEHSLWTAVWKLTLAWILIIVVAAILSTAIVLFFSLIGSSLGVVSGEAGQDITDMTAQMREGGTFYPLFILFMLTLVGVFWFTVRMMLFAVSTVTRGSVHVFRTWAWTKGYVLPMALGLVVFVLVPMIGLSYAAAGLQNAVSIPGGPASAAGLAALLQVPAAWLGHAFASAVYARIAPDTSISS
nr:hypothetical protein [Hyphomonas sp. Mor2]